MICDKQRFGSTLQLPSTFRLREEMLIGYVLKPKSAFRFSWDVVGALLIIYDLIIVPAQFLDFQETSLTTAMVWATRLYWAVDIPLTLRTGYMNRQGDYEMKPAIIFQHY